MIRLQELLQKALHRMEPAELRELVGDLMGELASAKAERDRLAGEGGKTFMCTGCGTGPFHWTWDPDPAAQKAFTHRRRPLGPCRTGAD